MGVNTLRNKHQKGFTLIELLVVIAIIGLLASVVLLALNSARQKSRDAKRLADIRQLATALELYYNSNNAYPVQASAATTIPGLAPGYIGTLPAAPTPADGTTCSASTGGIVNNSYGYKSDATGSTYTLTFCLGQVTGGYASQTILNLTPAGIQ